MMRLSLSSRFRRHAQVKACGDKGGSARRAFPLSTGV